MPYVNKLTKTIYKSPQDVMDAFPKVMLPNRGWTDEDLAQIDVAVLHYPEIINDCTPYEELVEFEPIEVNGKWFRTLSKQPKTLSFANQVDEDRFISLEKERVRAGLATRRYENETSAVYINIDGRDIYFPTDRVTQQNITSVFFAFSSGLITETVWKVSQGVWVTLTTTNCINVVSSVLGHVQAAFEWEKNLNLEIDDIETLEDLKTWVLNNPRIHPEDKR